MTIDEIKAKAEMLLKNSRETQGEFVQVYNNGFEDGVNFVLQNLQQTDCTALLELLEQMLKEENEALGKAGFYEQYKRETHANQKYCLAIVKQMIEARLPVA